MEIILKNAIVLLPTRPLSFARKDVLISGVKIAKIAPPNSLKGGAADEVADCSKKILMPGLVNTHSHAAMTLLRGEGDDLRLHDWLEKITWPKERKMSSDSVYAGTNLAIAEMLLSGTTNFNDHYFHMDSVAKSVEESGIRATLGYSMIDIGDYEGKGVRELEIADKFCKDWQGKNSRILVSVDPHAPYTCTKELLLESKKLAKKHKCKIHVHLAETRKELVDVLKSTGKRPADYLNSLGLLGKETVAAHCVYVSKSEISLMAKSGMSVSHCPVSNLKLASGGAMPMPEMIESNLNVSLGTDGAASNNSLDMFETAKIAALEQKNFRFDASAVKADDVLRMAFEGGSDALGVNAGRIKEGALADIILLDASAPNLTPFHPNAGYLLYAAQPQNLVDVMVDGKWLVRGRELLTMDLDAVVEKAKDAAALL